MICHLSIPARDPVRAATVVARLIDGTAMPYPIVKGSMIVVANDNSGLAIEVWPETTTQSPGTGKMLTPEDPQYKDEFGLKKWDYKLDYESKPSDAFPIHIALSTKLTIPEIVELGESQGWRVVHTDRVAFEVVELWVEDRVLLECIPEERELARYLDFTTPDRARRAFESMTVHH